MKDAARFLAVQAVEDKITRYLKKFPSQSHANIERLIASDSYNYLHAHKKAGEIEANMEELNVVYNEVIVRLIINGVLRLQVNPEIAG